MKLLTMAGCVFTAGEKIYLRLLHSFCPRSSLVCFRENKRDGGPQDELGRMPKYREHETPVSSFCIFVFS
jgi:hypothetical protein